MNVIRGDHMNNAKKIRGRRQKSVRSFFSGYYTVSKIVPSVNSSNLRDKNFDSFKFLADVKHSEKTDKQSEEHETLGLFNEKSTTSGSNDVRRSNNESTGSTSLEFKKLLAPFQNCLESNFSDDTDENFSELLDGKISTQKSLPDFSIKETSDSVFKKPMTVKLKRSVEKKQTTSGPLLNLDDSLSALHQSNILSLRPPKNQKSIEKFINSEIFKNDSNSHSAVLEEIRTPNNKKLRNFTSSSSCKTPKSKTAKFPGVSSSSKLTVSEAEAYILAVTEGRGHARGEVGIAAMNPKRPHLILCQISDTQQYVHSLTKMNVFDFVEVIVPNTFVDGPASNKLYCDIRSRFPTVTLTSVQRRHFNETVGIDLIKQYCSPESTSVMVLLRDKFYALSAAAALIKYIEFTQNVHLAPRSLKIEYQGTEDTMIIDLDTANLLELVMCTNHPETNLNHSLMGAVKHCRTKGGVRLLRANILQPPCSLAKIMARLDCVNELVDNPLMLCTLEAAVINFTNVESLLNLCMHPPQQEGLKVAEYQLKYTLLLKTILELLPALSLSLQDAKSEYFCEVKENLKDARYNIILEKIQETIFENAKTVKGSVAAHLHGCFAIKTGINSLLDVAKKTYCEIVQEISDHITKLREKYNMILRISFSANKGFHIQYTLPPGQRNVSEKDLPKEFILIQKSKSSFSFYTTELVALDQRSQHVLNEIKLMTNVILFELLTNIREYIGCLFNLCEHIAVLDLLISFAHVGSGTNYTRPKFGDELSLKESRHPILDVIYDGEVIPNDAFVTNSENFMILTGPNQSGKSIYIRQIALLQIMAQIGCYVPAKEATFRVTDRIFSRLAFDDSLESNASTLIVEMKDIEYLKQNLTPCSLVIIDELCRGTSVDEGTSLAFAICEELLDSSAFIFFTTHYLFLTKLEEMYYNVKNYHFETKLETSENGKCTMQFTHKMKPGPLTCELYGLQVAEMTSFPKDIISRAKELASKLSTERKANQSVSALLAQYKLSLELRTELTNCDPETDWAKMNSVIQRFKHTYLNISNSEDTEEYQLLIDSTSVPGSSTPKADVNFSEGNETVFDIKHNKNKKNPKRIFSEGGLQNRIDTIANNNKYIFTLANKIKKKYTKLRVKNKKYD